MKLFDDIYSIELPAHLRNTRCPGRKQPVYLSFQSASYNGSAGPGGIGHTLSNLQTDAETRESSIGLRRDTKRSFAQTIRNVCLLCCDNPRSQVWRRAKKRADGPRARGDRLIQKN